MAWPASGLTTTYLDDAADSPASARTEIKAVIDKVETILDDFESGTPSILKSSGNVSYSSGVFIVNVTASTYGSSTGGVNTIQVFQPTTSYDAFMSFHVSGDFAAHFGIDGTTNDLFVGGWSFGGVKHRVWHAGNDGAGSGLDADLLDGQSSAYYRDAGNLNAGTLPSARLGDTTSYNVGSPLQVDYEGVGSGSGIYIGDLYEINCGRSLYDFQLRKWDTSAHSSGYLPIHVYEDGSIELSTPSATANLVSLSAHNWHDGSGYDMALRAWCHNENHAFVVVDVCCDRPASSSYTLMNMLSNYDDAGDIEFSFRGDGQAYADGSWNGGGADYAEYFEWMDGNPDNEDRCGCVVVVDASTGGKMRIATPDDLTRPRDEMLMGVISANPTVVGDAAELDWAKKWKTDDFGRREIDEKGNQVKNPDYVRIVLNEEDKYQRDENGQIVYIDPPDERLGGKKGAKAFGKVPALNSGWTPKTAYVPRSQRKEWGAVGVLGKLWVRPGQAVPAWWIPLEDGRNGVKRFWVR